MVKTVIMGRLGNQMFQYAHARAFADKYNQELHIYFHHVNNQLAKFKIDDYIEDSKLEIPFFQRLILILFLIIRRVYSHNDRAKQQKLEIKLNHWLARHGIIFNTVGYMPDPKIKKKNILIVGYFEDYRYFKNIESSIKEAFVLKDNLSNDAKMMLNNIKNTNSVAVSIRRGDFVDLDNVVCGTKYFSDALKIINAKVNSPKFFVFSDDIEWVKQNMDFPKGTVYEPSTISVYENVFLRANCKHFILSNSTFSWWGAYLSQSVNKMVIAPKYWRFTDAKIEIVLDDWIKVDNSKK